MKDFPEDKKYDVTIVIGVFDYIHDPVPFLIKTQKITKNKIISSFPAKYNFQSSLRKIWLKSRNCPVYFYTEEKIKNMFIYLAFEILYLLY